MTGVEQGGDLVDSVHGRAEQCHTRPWLKGLKAGGSALYCTLLVRQENMKVKVFVFGETVFSKN